MGKFNEPGLAGRTLISQLVDLTYSWSGSLVIIDTFGSFTDQVESSVARPQSGDVLPEPIWIEAAAITSTRKDQH